MFLKAVFVGVVLAVGPAPSAPQDDQPLTDSQGRVVFEGRRIILDSDSYPREFGKVVDGPTVDRRGDQWVIAFQIDKFDDVLVRVLDVRGNVVRALGCGVLGPNAPAPFQKDTLRQSLAWDGHDTDGKPAPANCRVEVSVGLAPRFERFIGHDPAQLLKRIIWLEVDPRGRVYVQVAAGRKSDPTMLRFSREGEYLDMVYPSNPHVLAESGKKIEDVWPYVARYEGEPIPHRPRSWPTFVPYRANARIPFPMRIAGDGTVYFAESTTGYPPWASHGELLRIFTTQMDRFWFLETMPLMYSIGPFAIDDKGFGYVVTSTAGRCTGTYPPTRKALNDPKAPGTIRKVNLNTKELQADFQYNGKQRLTTNSAYLGVTQTVSSARSPGRREPDPSCDDDKHFRDLADLTVDPAGRILVVDGWPRRIKIYEGNGQFVGEVSGLRVEDKRRDFQDLRGIAWGTDGFYLLGVFRDQTDRAFIAKCTGDLAGPSVTWIAELDAAACHLAVDRRADPALIWVGMGHGPATLTRITDLGSRAGTVMSVGGVRPRTFLYPWNLVADASGHLYVHDRDRESLIRTNDSLTEWEETRLRGAPTSLLADNRNKRLLISYSLGENGAYSLAKSEEDGFLCLDLETLKRLPFRLQPVYTHAALQERDRFFAKTPQAYYPWAKTYGGLFAGMDSAGNLYVRDAARNRPWHKATPTDDSPCAGVIRKYGPDGKIADEAVCRLFSTGGGVAMDSRGSLYAVELPLINWLNVVHNFAAAIGDKSFGKEPRRGKTRIRTQSGFTHLVKMDAKGGARNTNAEFWAHRGVSCTNGGGCYCDWPDMHVSVDAADRVFVADIDLHMVKILDTAGNMIARFGRWGNAETTPGPDGDARDLGFRMIYCLTTSRDAVYVSDKDLRRIAKIKMGYRETRVARVP